MNFKLIQKEITEIHQKKKDKNTHFVFKFKLWNLIPKWKAEKTSKLKGKKYEGILF